MKEVEAFKQVVKNIKTVIEKTKQLKKGKEKEKK